MTIVVVWKEPQDDVLWCVADTRISNDGPGGGVIVATDNASKILTLPIVCRKPSPDPNIQRFPFFQGSFGFAFAGDVLPAMLTYSAVSTFLQNLVSYGPDGASSGAGIPISVHDAANLCAKLGNVYSSSILGANNGKYGRFECIVFGWCPQSDAYRISQITPFARIGEEMSVTTTTPTCSSDPIVIGRRELFRSAFENLRTEGDSFGRTARLPKIAVERAADASIGDVGGSTSIAVAHRNGLQLLCRVSPVNPGEPAAKIAYNGLELTEELLQVGHCSIDLRGMV